MTELATALSSIPNSLLAPLLQEHARIQHNYLTRRWSAAEVAGGRYCEIVYTVLEGLASGSFAAKPSKPANFPDACKKLESQAALARGLRILVPRLMTALYEMRNNRDAGHVGGDVNSNAMDASLVAHAANWILAEMVRALHGVSIEDAAELVAALGERRTPLVWARHDTKRVLDSKLTVADQLLVLLDTCPGSVSVADLLRWLDNGNPSYAKRVLRELHRRRQVDVSADGLNVEILPPGSEVANRVQAGALVVAP